MRVVEIKGGSVGIAEDGDPIDPGVEKAEAERAQVVGLVDDVRTLRDAIKAAPAGALTLTRAQHLALVRGLLFLLKGEKIP